MIVLNSICSYGIPVLVQIPEGFARFPMCWKKKLTFLFKAEVSSCFLSSKYSLGRNKGRKNCLCHQLVQSPDNVFGFGALC